MTTLDKEYTHVVMTAVEVKSNNPNQPTWAEGIAGLEAKVAELKATEDQEFTPMGTAPGASLSSDETFH